MVQGKAAVVAVAVVAVAVAQHSITMYKTPTAGVQQLQNILGAQQIKML